MSESPFRFLHSGDFRLDQPMDGMSEIPEHLQDLLIDAPYRAAARVFETAVREQVGCVLLSGDLLDLKTPSARALAFMQEQFCRLDEHGIPVFWAGGSFDAGADWPAAVPLPLSVMHFDADEVGVGTVTWRDRVTISVSGRSAAGRGGVRAIDFQPDSDNWLSIAVVNDKVDPGQLVDSEIDYWALGGQTGCDTLLKEPTVAHFAGTPQGRSPSDVGPHGCTLVEVQGVEVQGVEVQGVEVQGVEVQGAGIQGKGSSKLRFIECDVVQWQHARVVIASAESQQEIQQALARHIERFQSAASGKTQLVTWDVVVQEQPKDIHRLSQESARLNQWLRDEFGRGTDPCWSISVDVTTDDRVPPRWYEEDTLLGDYLRAARVLHKDETIDLGGLLSDRGVIPSEVAKFFELADAESRSAVVREASELGAMLLRGDVDSCARQP